MTRAWLFVIGLVGVVGLLVALSGSISPSYPRDATLSSEMYGSELKGLSKLLEAAQEARSDAVVILKDGKLVGEWYFGKSPELIETMSVTKSIVNLAIGRLITLGLLESVDVPVYTFYPEWKQGLKQKITLRHILSHTSGLQNVPDTRVEIYPSPDFVQLALAAELSYPPGTKFEYNNKAVNLLAGIVEKVSGKKLDEFMRDEIFAPLGIREFDWMRDQAGNPHAMAGLALYPRDLAKLGQLVLNKGEWRGQRLIDERWFEESFRPLDLMPDHGLLWWLLRDSEGNVIGYWAQGFLGQYLVIYPEKRLVGVRMIAYFDGYDPQKHTFGRFPQLLYRLGEDPSPDDQAGASTSGVEGETNASDDVATVPEARMGAESWWESLVEQGVLARLWQGRIIRKEAFTLRKQGEGFVLLMTAEFQESGYDRRLSGSFILTPEYRLQGYIFVQAAERQDGTQELVSGQIAFSEGQARAEIRWTQPGPLTQGRTWKLPADRPVFLLQPGMLSDFVVLTRLFVSLGAQEATLAYVYPLLDAEEPRIARLRRLEPATIVAINNGRERETTAERFELTLEATGEVIEIVHQNGEFLGAVAVGYGEDEAFIFRWDLFPESFRVKR